MVDTNMTNSQFNLTNFLDDITRKNEPHYNVTSQSFSSQPDIANQDDLLLISELLILSLLYLAYCSLFRQLLYNCPYK